MVGLRQFSEKELLLDVDETRAVLSFFFAPKADRISTMEVTDKVRGFAQGLLLEAIDASFAMGFVEALFRSFAKPGVKATAAIKKLAKLAAKHWFKHATTKCKPSVACQSGDDRVKNHNDSDNLWRGGRDSNPQLPA